MAVKAGCDINCGNTYIHLMAALEQGLIEEADIDRAVEKAMEIRLRLGMLEETEYDNIPFDVIDCPEHNALSLEAAEKSMVLLKNRAFLPLDKHRIKSIAVIGPNADSRAALYGNYQGTASRYVTFLEGIEDAFGGRVYYAEGCHLFKDRVEGLALPADRISEAVAAAKNADVSVLCLGLDASLEGEEGDAGNAYASGDKTDLRLPEPQRLLLKSVLDVGKPVVVVLAAGSSLNIEDDRPAALIQAWYPGSKGGKALAEILFGEVSPSGKLPVTFYESAEALPDFCDYSMAQRTYKNVKGNVLYPFGFGLTYSSMYVKSARYEGGEVVCTAENIGDTDTGEVLEVYSRSMSAFAPKNPAICGFARIFLKAGESAEFHVKLSEDAFTDVDDNGVRGVHSEEYLLYVGFSQPDEKSEALGAGRGIWIRRR